MVCDREAPCARALRQTSVVHAVHHENSRQSGCNVGVFSAIMVMKMKISSYWGACILPYLVLSSSEIIWIKESTSVKSL